MHVLSFIVTRMIALSINTSCRTCAIVSAGQVGRSIVIFHGMYNFIDKSSEPHSQVGANQMHETETNDGQLFLAVILQVIIKKYK